jgi:hypothetical protein
LLILGVVGALAASDLPAQFGAIGLSGVGGQRFANEDLLFFEPQAGDHLARVLATGDFDGDGADDLAAGMPHDNGIVGFEIENCGAVVVRHGVPGGGLATDLADTFLSQLTGGSPDPAEAEDNFGGALAACDFNADGFDDLAVGIPNEDVNGVSDAGAVQIYYGSGAGLGTAGPFLTQATAGIPGDPEPSEFLGFSLACGRFDGDGFADLAIGVPHESIGDQAIAGAVVVVHGAAGGLDPSSAVFLSQDTGPMQGTAELGDEFGFALAVGNFDSDGHDDLAIGIPGEDSELTPIGARGAVAILFGNANPFPFGGNILLTEDELGGGRRNGDRFGEALAAGDFDGNLFDDLAIGSPSEIDEEVGADVGQVIVRYHGPGAPAPRVWTEDDVHGVGSSEAGDRFGFALASGDFDGDGRDDLAIGGPGESVLVPQDGMVTVVMGSPTGITNLRRMGLAAGFHGNPGVQNQANRNYGSAVATGDFDGDGYADLSIGAPNENENEIADVGAIVVLFGSLFADGFEVQNTGFWSTAVP